MRPDPHAPPHQRVEVNEHILAQQGVDGVFADPVPCSDGEQMGALIRRVMVDVHVRMLASALRDVVKKLGERLAFFGVGVRPERAERAVGLDQSEEVVDPPGCALLIQRVALEIEEDVASVGLWHGGEGGRVVNLDRRRAASIRRDLQGCLATKRLECAIPDPGDRADGGGELVDGGHTGIRQFDTLRYLQPGDHQHVTVGGDFGLAARAVSADGVPLVVPVDRFGVGKPLIDEKLQARTALAIDGEDVAEPVLADGSVAEQQLCGVGRCHPDADELFCVCGELQQGGDLGPPRQFAVLHLVAPVRLAHDEVGESDKAAVEECRLEHDLCPARESPLGRGGGFGKFLRPIPGRPFDLDDAAGLPVPLEFQLLVQIAQLARPREDRIIRLSYPLDAPELGIEYAQERKLAPGRGSQVARAGDDCFVEQEHWASGWIVPPA